MTLDLLFALMLFALISGITPGPNNLMLMTSGANFGLVRSLPHMAGVGLGFAFMVLLVGLGIMAVFDHIPGSYRVLQLLSLAYLLYLAYRIAVSSGPETGTAGRARPFSFVQAAAFQWVNPKAWTMAVSAVTVYAPTQTVPAVAIIALVYIGTSLVSTTSWVLLGQSLQQWLQQPQRLRWFNGSMALLLLVSLVPVLLNR